MGKVIKVRVVPGSKKRSIEAFAGGLKVRLTAVPVDGKANKALIEVLASHYGIRRSVVRILKGARSKDKTVVIDI